MNKLSGAQVPLFFSAFCSMMIGSSVMRTPAAVTLAGVGANAAEIATRFTAQLGGAGFANPSIVPAVDAEPKSEGGGVKVQQVGFQAATGTKVSQIADALQTNGSDGAIEAWKVRDLGLPYSRNDAVTIKIASYREDLGNGKARIYTVSTFNLDKRYVLMARGLDNGNVMIIALDDNASILGGRWWRNDGNSDISPESRNNIYTKDTPLWANRLGVTQVASTTTGS